MYFCYPFRKVPARISVVSFLLFIFAAFDIFACSFALYFYSVMDVLAALRVFCDLLLEVSARCYVSS